MSELDEVPFVAVGNDELESRTIWVECRECGERVEFSVGEMIRCLRDERRPRPRCACGHEVRIGKAVEV